MEDALYNFGYQYDSGGGYRCDCGEWITPYQRHDGCFRTSVTWTDQTVVRYGLREVNRGVLAWN